MALSTDKVIEECNDLIRFDHDAIGAYEEAINKIGEMWVREPLISFRADHQRHINELSALVTKLGGKPVDHAGLRGVVRKTMTRMAGMAGTEMVLKAMKSNEELLNREYANRLKLDLPSDVMALVRKNFADEQRHLAWVEQALRARLWEQQPAHP